MKRVNKYDVSTMDDGSVVRTITSFETGVECLRQHFRDNALHREDGPAFIRRDPYTGVMVREEWAVNGRTHRPDGPALIIRNRETGRITQESWFQDGAFIPHG